MKLKSFYLLLLLATIFTWSCEKDADVFAPVISGADVDTVLNIGDKLVLAPDITNLVGVGYTWLVNGEEVASGKTDYTFAAIEPGNFVVTFRAANKGGQGEQKFKILVEKPIAITLKSGLTVPICQVLDIEPYVDGPERNDYEYQWAIGDSIIGQSATLPFISVKPGDYTLMLTATAGKQSTTASCGVVVEEAEYSPYVTSLLEYSPSYGNISSLLWLQPFNRESVEFSYPYSEYLTAVSQHIKEQHYSEFGLGWWGGSAVFAFDHTVVNTSTSTSDIQLYIFDYSQNEHAFWVAYDQNKNGKPDNDEWYEIKTDNWGKGDVLNYELTNIFSIKDLDDEKKEINLGWTDNQGNDSPIPFPFEPFELPYVLPGSYFKDGISGMYDGWKDTYTLKGRLIKTQIPLRGAGARDLRITYNIKIADAVDEYGDAVQLPGIDFLKVQNISMPYKVGSDTPLESVNVRVFSIKDNHLQ